MSSDDEWTDRPLYKNPPTYAFAPTRFYPRRCWQCSSTEHLQNQCEEYKALCAKYAKMYPAKAQVPAPAEPKPQQ